METLQLRAYGGASLPTLIYLPGLHGDWTLVTSFRAAIADRARFVEISYPRTLTWSLEDYAAAIESALLANQITRGWLLGESFGSQIVWKLLARWQANAELVVPPSGGRASALPRRVESPDVLPPEGGTPCFQPAGVILAGGFVQHPVTWEVRCAFALTAHAPAWCRNICAYLFGQYARLRRRRSPEALADVQEFIRRRQEPLDQRAIQHRLKLVAENDPSPIARQTTLPVYALAGLVDPIVPWPFVRRWLKRYCPGYRGGKTFVRADHNVLGCAPQKAADLVWQWMNETKTASAGTPAPPRRAGA